MILKDKNKLLPLLLALTLSASTTTVFADDSSSSGDGFTSTLQQIQGFTSGTNGINSSIGAAQGSVQNLINQFTAGKQNQIMGGTNTMAQVQGQLAQALTTAQSCMTKANADISQYQTAGNKNASAEDILNAPLTCGNYADVKKGLKAQSAKLDEVMKRIGCMSALQAAMDKTANDMKQPFQQVIQAANDAWNIDDRIINQYDQMATKIDGDVNGPNGFQAKLDDLSSTVLQLQSALNGPPGGQIQVGGVTVQSGLGQAATNARKARNQTANNWQQMILTDTVSCFNSDSSQQCDASGVPMAPKDCLMAEVSRNASGQAVSTAQAARNTTLLQQVFGLQSGSYITSASQATLLDAEDINGFLSYSNSVFQNMNSTMSTALANKKFIGIDSSSLTAFFQSKMSTCYQNAINNFQSSIKSDKDFTSPINGRTYQYSSTLDQITNSEKSINSDTQTLMTALTAKMTAFKTSFNKTYSTSLSNFAAGCSMSSSVDTSLDCLRTLSVTLQSGIDGAAHSIQLSNGTTFNHQENPITVNVQVLQADSQGNPTTGTSPLTCVGYTDCLTQMKNVEQNDKDQKVAVSNSRDSFVTAANKNVQTSMAAFSGLFAQMSQILGSGVGGINGQLGGLGVNGTIKTQQAEGESLAQDDKTHLYTMPKSMKAALASQGSFTELDEDSLTDTRKAVDTRKKAITKKFNEVSTMQANCTIQTKDYKSLADALPKQCTDIKNVCSTSKRSLEVANLEKLLIKGQSTVSSDDLKTPPIIAQLKSDLADAKSSNSANDCILKSLTVPKDQQADVLKACQAASNSGDSPIDSAYDTAESSLQNLSSNVTDPNSKTLYGDYASLSDACDTYDEASPKPSSPASTDDPVTKACQALKDDATNFKATPPPADDDTPKDDAPKVKNPFGSSAE